MTGWKDYKWGSHSRPEAIFPFTKAFGGKDYTQSLANPLYVVNCKKERAEKTVVHIRKEGWAARVVKFVTSNGNVYLVYERRTGREMRPKKGHRVLGTPK